MKPKDCKHPTCDEGECRKCAYNPSSSYPAWHCQSAPKYQYGWPAMVLTAGSCGAISWVWTAGYGLFLVVGSVMILIVFLACGGLKR